MPTSPHSTLRARSQLTLPPEIRQALNVSEGDEIMFQPEADGTVRLIPARIIPASQAWFWTEEWQQGEREVDADIAAGRTTGPLSPEEFFAYLNEGSDDTDVRD